jgi:hypothetical protein
MHHVIKFAQLRDVLVCDFIDVIKICEGNGYYMYCDSKSFFKVICSLIS